MAHFDADVIVIGSGFGGSVAALRAAEAGRSVLVLEQGRRLTDADLQRGAESTRRLLWEPRLGLHGYFAQTMLRDAVIVSGVGVGGGSIVYAAVLLAAPDEVLAGPTWAGSGVDWARELRPYVATAAGMLGVRPNPTVGLQDRWLRRSAELMGADDTFGPTPQGIDFDACIGCSQCITGCPHGAKKSLDRTYLPRAEAAGARIEPRSRAEILVPLSPDGAAGWRVVVRDPLDRRAPPRSLHARSVVVAAGVLGTVRLLLAGRDRWRTLPRLSPLVGHRVRTNSEAFAAVLHPPGTDISTGATISSHFYPDAATHITNNRFPKSYSFMKWYLSPWTDLQDPAGRRRSVLRALVGTPAAATAAARARDWHRRTTVLTVMQHTDNELALTYDRRWRVWALRSRRGDGAASAPSHLPQADAAGRALAEASGGTAFGTYMDSLLGIGATAHILGGAVVGVGPGSGVVGTDQRVFGYRGLRILDGSAVPGNVGVNPSLTITAMAERAMARWLGGR